MKYLALYPLLLPCLITWASATHAKSGSMDGDIEDEDLALAYADKAIVSIATGSSQPLRRAPAVTSVVTTDDIAALGPTSLEQILETVPGLHVARSPVTYTPLYLMRGIGGGGVATPQVLLLQNGVPMTVAYNGDKGGNWGGLPADNIARVEIIRGPGSALYGADAYAGVINIITRTASDTPGTLASVGGGTFNNRYAAIRHGGKLGDWSLATYLRVGSSNGMDGIVSADAQTLNDQRFGTRVSHAPGPVNTGYDSADASVDLARGKWRWRGHYLLRDHMGSGAGVNSALDPVGTARSERLSSDLSWNEPELAESWSGGIVFSAMHYKETSPYLLLFPAGARIGPSFFPEGMIGGPSRWQRQFRASAYAAYGGWRDHYLRLGVGHDDINLYKASTLKNFLLTASGLPVPTGPQRDYGDIQPHIQPQRRKNNYFYIQDEWQLARDWTLTAGLRHDQYSDFGGVSNPRMALVWDASLNVTAKLLYGAAFRAPSFNEQYGINPVASGNPALRPETIETWEAALAWQIHNSWQLNINAFQYQMKDIIRLVANPSPAPGATYNNIGAQHGRGVEIDTNWDISRALRLSANYAYQHGVDEASNQDAGYAPRQHIYVRAAWRMTDGWQLQGQANRIAGRQRGPGDRRPVIAGYTTVDISLHQLQRKRGWTLSANVQNLFAAEVREPSAAPGTALPNDLPMAGRVWQIQANYLF